MKLNITLIRSGITQGGKDGRYIGVKDEMLLEEDALRIQSKASKSLYPTANLVYTSDLLRCRETATIIYPRFPAIVLKELRALDYGAFTGLSYNQIIRDKQFLEWAAAEEVLPIKDGDNPLEQFARNIQAFRMIAKEMQSKGIGSASVITHKTVISTILKRFHLPRSYYTDWNVDYGGGYTVDFCTDTHAVKLKGTF